MSTTHSPDPWSPSPSSSAAAANTAAGVRVEFDIDEARRRAGRLERSAAAIEIPFLGGVDGAGSVAADFLAALSDATAAVALRGEAMREYTRQLAAAAFDTIDAYERADEELSQALSVTDEGGVGRV
ncbi:hypothetical protein C1Y63_06465 [Corynebacterium sp. 13CS0277]|uniref:hypothetical protein n=1 Tax=Corynebacterium sp. 13CS0277 TaxID=2071994 RepID=UPI000D04576E|nr:hypothetical protein [Corynebacterium sp. 13CS0277]PRQ11348.1 hypothetical protein C1Y63_06465 [Corynebacterium sp. 13CS0277]